MRSFIAPRTVKQSEAICRIMTDMCFVRRDMQDAVEAHSL